MKAKVSLLVIALISAVIIFSSCERKSGRRTAEMKKVEKVSTLKSDTLLFSPEKIGTTEMVEEFIPYPKYDGGTGIDVSFSIGIQYKGKTYEINVNDREFFSENITREKAKNGQHISKSILAHYLVSNTPKDCIDVMVVKGEVVKLTRRSAFIANEFYSTKIIWERKF